MGLPERGVSGKSGTNGDCGVLKRGGGINGGLVPKPCQRAAGAPSVILGTGEVGRVARGISIVQMPAKPQGL